MPEWNSQWDDMIQIFKSVNLSLVSSISSFLVNKPILVGGKEAPKPSVTAMLWAVTQSGSVWGHLLRGHQVNCQDFPSCFRCPDSTQLQVLIVGNSDLTVKLTFNEIILIAH